MHRYLGTQQRALGRGLMVVVLALTIVAATAWGRQCGDCDGNGRVTIAELVTAVANALEPIDPCSCEGCAPSACVEFPMAIVDGAEWTCIAEACVVNTIACVRHLLMTAPSRCYR